MASTDPLKNELFVEEVEALFNHALFLRDQIQRGRDQLKVLHKMNNKDDLTEADRKMVRQLQTELVNNVKDLDETTKKITGSLGLPVVEIDDIEVNKHETEKYGISPLPDQRKSILSRVPKILVPLSQGNIVRFGFDDKIADIQGNEVSNSSVDQYISAGTCSDYRKPSDKEITDHASISEITDHAGISEITDHAKISEITDHARISTHNIINTHHIATKEVDKNADPNSIITVSKECLEQLAVKDAILNDLKDQLYQRQCELIKLNAKNDQLKNKIDDMAKGQEKDDDDLTSTEFVKRYAKRLRNKDKRIKYLETLGEEIEDAKEQEIFKKRLKYIKKLEKIGRTSNERIRNVKAMSDILNKYHNMPRSRDFEAVDNIDSEPPDDLTNEFKDIGDENNTIDRSQFLKLKKFVSEEDNKKFYGNQQYEVANWGENEGRNYYRQALGKCCKFEGKYS